MQYHGIFGFLISQLSAEKKGFNARERECRNRVAMCGALKNREKTLYSMNETTFLHRYDLVSEVNIYRSDEDEE